MRLDSHPRFDIPFPGKPVTANFEGGHISSDGGLVLSREVDRALGLTGRLAGCVRDERDQSKVKQSVRDMLIQRIFGIACGYEDCNDHDTLRSDPMLKMSVDRAPERGEDLASQPTLSRLENSVGARELYRMSEVLLEVFLARHCAAAPSRIVIDADATDDPAHGQQQFEFFHGFYGCHCFLPLLVYLSADDGAQELVAAVLRPGNVHAGHRLVSVLKRLVPRLREAFPETEVVFRGDAGMALPAVYDYLEDQKLSYLISLPKNDVLLCFAEPFLEGARALHEQTSEKVRRFGEFRYAARTWGRERRVIVKAEILLKGENPRFVLTNLEGAPEALYEEYVDRGDVENRIKELKDDLLSGRTSCQKFLANQFRLILHACAFLLVSAIRQLLSGTEMARAQVGTIRVRLLKVGARVRETTRRIWVQMPTSYPYQKLWDVVLTRLTPGVT